MSVKKVLTFKSGKFVFSHFFSEACIQPLLVEFRTRHQIINDLPLLPSQSAELETELIRRSIFSTAAIEGNPLLEEEVGEILQHPDSSSLTETKELEIRKLKKAYAAIAEISSRSGFSLSEEFIKTTHATLTTDLAYEYNLPGCYRNHRVKVGDKQHGGVDTPPKCLKDIQNLMAEFITWFNSKDLQTLDIAVQASLAHYFLARIHPFGDGNGRTARIIEGALLKSADIRFLPAMLSNYYYRNMDNYFSVFASTRKNKAHDVTDFIEFVLKGCIHSLCEVQKRLTFSIRKATLRDYYTELRQEKRISQRQLQLLHTLLGLPESTIITLQNLLSDLPFTPLYVSVSERTARRDLIKLQEIGLLKPSKQGGYLLEWRLLNVA